MKRYISQLTTCSSGIYIYIVVRWLSLFPEHTPWIVILIPLYTTILDFGFLAWRGISCGLLGLPECISDKTLCCTFIQSRCYTYSGKANVGKIYTIDPSVNIKTSVFMILCEVYSSMTLCVCVRLWNVPHKDHYSTYNTLENLVLQHVSGNSKAILHCSKQAACMLTSTTLPTLCSVQRHSMTCMSYLFACLVVLVAFASPSVFYSVVCHKGGIQKQSLYTLLESTRNYTAECRIHIIITEMR